LIAVNPTNRLSLVCIKAPQAPKTIDPVDANKKKGCQKKRKIFVPNKKNKTLVKKAKTPSFTTVEKKNVTGVKTPSYTSGAQAWQGKIESLNQKPKKIKIKAKDKSSGKSSTREKRKRSSPKPNALVMINTKEVPNSRKPEDNAPKQKYFIPDSKEFCELESIPAKIYKESVNPSKLI
jgi:hypothetical protein